MEKIRDTIKASRAVIACLAAASLAIAVTGCAESHAETPKNAIARQAGSGISVIAAHPERKTVRGTLAVSGSIRAETEVSVVAETQGKAVAVYATAGKRVEKNDVLAQIDDELKASALKTAQAMYDKSKSDWTKAQDLFTQKVISDSDLQGAKLAFANADSQLLAAKKDYENAKVRAPIAGIVSEKNVTVGSMLAPGSPVATIVDIDDLKMTVQVGERDILKIRKGMSAEITTDFYPGEVFKGTVSSVSPKGDAALTFPVEIALKSDAQKPLYDGMSATASVNLESKSILALPRAALVGERQSPQVYVVEKGKAKTVSVLTGGEYGTSIEILKGLDETDLIVTEGQNNLSDGAAVTVVENPAQ